MGLNNGPPTNGSSIPFNRSSLFSVVVFNFKGDFMRESSKAEKVVDWAFLLLAGVLLALCLVAPYAEAQSHPIDLVVIQRAEISTTKQIELFQLALNRLKEVNIQAHIASVREYQDEVQENSLAANWSRMFDWQKWADRKRIRNKNRIMFFLLPPLDNTYQSGAGGAQCVTTRNTSRRYGYSVMRLKNNAGLDRIEASITIALHELLHLFGAGHIDSKQNVMRSWYVPGPQPILPLTKRELRYCKQGLNPLGRKSL